MILRLRAPSGSSPLGRCASPPSVRSPLRLLLALGFSLTALSIGAKARADTSAWVFVGGGAVGWRCSAQQQDSESRTPCSEKLEQGSKAPVGVGGALAVDVGVGTSPDGPFIVGGFFRFEPIFGSGIALALSARVATRGFQTGGFGLTLDAGGYARFGDATSQGFAGGVTLGAPLGLQLSLQAMVGTRDALAFGAVAGVDLLRLTIYRQTLLDRWQNPSPAWRRLGRALGLVGARF
jgi:hypothetical protein